MVFTQHNCLHSMKIICLLQVLFCRSLLAFDLTILHTNDVHDRMEQFDSGGGVCSEDEAEMGICYGGVARRATVINDIRRMNPM